MLRQEMAFILLIFSQHFILGFNKVEESGDALSKDFPENEVSVKFIQDSDIKTVYANNYPASSIEAYYNLDFNSTEFNDTIAIVENLRVDQVQADALQISWTVSGTNVTMFFIEWFTNNEMVDNATGSFPVTSEEKFVYKITNLDACSEYKIVVTPHVDEPVEEKEIFAKTAETQTGAPLILTADPCDLNGTLALNISWQRPKVGGFCIEKYSVTVESKIHELHHSLTRNTSNTYIIIKQLFACTSYLVTVKSVGLNGEYGLSATIQSKPTNPKPSKAPRLINSESLPPFVSKATRIIFGWYVFDETNNCTIKSVNTMCKYAYTEGYGFELKDGNASVAIEGTVPRKIKLMVDGLSPFTNYFCFGSIVNEAATSGRSFPVSVLTMEDAPSAPQNFKLVNGSTFTWEPPTTMPGRLQRYKITFSWVPRYLVPDFCKVQRKCVLDDILSNTNNYTWHGGDGYSNYMVDIAACTTSGCSPYNTSIVFQSYARGVPDRVTKLEYETKSQANDPNVLETTLSWNLPCSLRGQLKHFEVFVFGTKNHVANHTMEGLVHAPPNYDKNTRFTINLGELRPQYFYKFHVSATIHEAAETGEVAVYDAEYPAGIPLAPDKAYMDIIKLKPEKMPHTRTSVEVLLPLFKNTNGDVKYYAIIVSRLSYRFEQAHTRFSLDDENAWPNISSWKEAMEENFEIPYQVTEPRWTPYPNYVVNYGSVKAVKFVIGEDVTCDALTADSRLYCNGPLKPTTSYRVWMRAFTNGGYSDSDYILVITEKEVSIYLIIGIVLGILTLGIVAAVLLSKMSYYNGKKNALHEEESDLEGNRNRRPAINSNPAAHESTSTSIRNRRRSDQPNEQN